MYPSPVEPAQTRRTPLSVKIVFALVVGALVAIIIVLLANKGSAVSTPTGQHPGQDAGVIPTSDSPEPTPPKEMPAAKDFTVALKTTSKQCFGSAGCNVEVMPDIAYNGLLDLSDFSCDVTYEITGDESGTVTETAYGDGMSASVSSSSLSTGSDSTDPEARVTDVSCH